MMKIKDDEIMGKRVRIKICEASEHNTGDCVCHLINKIVTISNTRKEKYAGYFLYFINKLRLRVYRSEVVLIRDQ